MEPTLQQREQHMRILFLDDEVDRQALYKFRHPDDDVVFVTNYQSAADALQDQSVFDLADLDYQLNDVEKVNGKAFERTGMHVVMLILSLPPEKRPKEVVCHSLNGFRRMTMVKALEKAGVRAHERPFE